MDGPDFLLCVKCAGTCTGCSQVTVSCITIIRAAFSFTCLRMSESSKNQAKSSPLGERQPLLKPLDLEKNEVAEAENTEKDNKILLIAFLLMLIFQLGNRIFGKLQTV